MSPPKTAKKTGAIGKKKSEQKRTQKAGSGISAKRARQDAFLVVLKAQRIFNVRRACADSGVSRTQFYEWLKKDKRFQVVVEDIVEGRKDDFEEDLQKGSRSGDSRSTIFFLERQARDRGYGKEPDSNKLKTILKRAKEGEISALDAAYEVNMLGLPLPEVLKIQLGKNEPPKPPDDRPPLTSEELEEKYLASLAIASGQRDGSSPLPVNHPDYFSLPDRQETIRVLKEDLKAQEQFESIEEHE